MEPRRRNPLRRYPTAVCISVWHFGLTQSKTRALNSPGVTAWQVCDRRVCRVDVALCGRIFPPRPHARPSGLACFCRLFARHAVDVHRDAFLRDAARQFACLGLAPRRRHGGPSGFYFDTVNKDVDGRHKAGHDDRRQASALKLAPMGPSPVMTNEHDPCQPDFGLLRCHLHGTAIAADQCVPVVPLEIRRVDTIVVAWCLIGDL